MRADAVIFVRASKLFSAFDSVREWSFVPSPALVSVAVVVPTNAPLPVDVAEAVRHRKASG